MVPNGPKVLNNWRGSVGASWKKQQGAPATAPILGFHPGMEAGLGAAPFVPSVMGPLEWGVDSKNLLLKVREAGGVPEEGRR